VLVVIATSDAHCCVQTLEQGADDDLGKPFEIEELVARVRAILRPPCEPRQRVREVVWRSMSTSSPCTSTANALDEA
jgi:DNA-binding response OmpR family regulator